MKTTAFVLALLTSSTLTYATNYYVSNSGNDSNSGTSTSTPWKTIAKVNTFTFSPGDQILFRNGETFYGGLILKGSGASGQPITVGAYDGYTIKPKIEGEGHVVNAILLENGSYWHIKDLDITNYGLARAKDRSGITVKSTAGTVLYGITISNMTIHHTNSMLDKGNEGAGIYIISENTGSRFDGLLIEDNHLFFVDRNGISQRTSNAARSTNVIIRNNLLEDIGGDCIKLWGSNGGLVEYNTVRGGSKRSVDASAGIWPFESDNSLIQYNEVSGMERCIDGQAFDSDYSCNNSVFQYNYSHDNQGGFFLLCAPDTMASNGAIIRYNISQNDGIAAADYTYPGTGFPEGATFTFGGHVTNSQIYNNVIYIRSGLNVPLVRTGSWDGGVPSDNFFSNNIFYVDGTARYQFDAGQTPVFDYNNFYGTHVSRPTDLHAVTAQPDLDSVNTGGNGLNTLNGYKFSALDNAFAGKLIASNGGKDFWGNTVSATDRPLMGAEDIPTGLIPDTTYPTAPTGLNASSITTSSFTLSWTAATDNVGIMQYEIYVDGNWKGNTPGSTLSYPVTGLSSNTTYAMTVIAKDFAGNWTLSDAINVKTGNGSLMAAPKLPGNSGAINIYPNPASDYLVISNIESDAKVTVFDIAGKMIYTSNQSNGGSMRLSVNSWIKGIYIIAVVSGSQHITKKVFIE